MRDLHAKFIIRPRNLNLEYRIKMRLTRLRRFLVHLQNEKRCPFRVSFRKRLKAWSLGFTSTSYALYDLDNNDPQHYLRDFPDMNYRLVFPGAATVNDKFNFARNMDIIGISSPEIFGMIDRGRILHTDNVRLGNNLKHWLVHLLGEHERFVLKPCYSGAGREVCFIEKKEDAYFINGVNASIDEIVNLIRTGRFFLVTEFVQQADYAAKIFPKTTNTVRILTLWDVPKNEPFIAAAAHRIGVEDSFPLDNFHGGGVGGGVSAKIDLDSGKLGPGACLSKTGQLLRHDRHPDTGVRIEGVVLPHWPETRRQVIKAACHFSFSPYIGWDMVLTEKGCTFLEGNCPPGAGVWQVHSPLLKDPRAKRFFQYHQMINCGRKKVAD